MHPRCGRPPCMPPEITPSASGALTLAAVLGAASFIIGLLNGILGFLDRWKEKPAPGETYVRITDFNQNRADMNARLDAQARSHEEDFAMLREEMQTLRQQIRDDVRRVHDRVDELPSQIIATLRNTGAIK